jgi:hypothetical protein
VKHREGRTVRLAWPADEDCAQPIDRALDWTTAGPWTYALGSFAAMQSLNGCAPWIVRIRGQLAGVYHSLDAAKRVIERAARAAGYEVDVE